MSYEIPYLPDIIEGVVARVNTVFSTRVVDPFNVYFDYGLQNDVTKNIYTKQTAAPLVGTFPLVWLVMNFREERDSEEVFSDDSVDLILAMPTEANYTMRDRTDISFKPRLFPIYLETIEQLKAEPLLRLPDGLKHTKIDLPYWGGGESAGAKNLFKNFIDAVQIKNLRLTKEHIQNCKPFSNF